MNRLKHLPTLRIDPAETRRFRYRGKTLEGLAGDTVASALFANGVRVFSRSLKYHRPRGLYSLDGECSNTMMAVDGEPNVRTETTWLEEGMTIEAQNVIGTPEYDLMAVMDKFSWAMPAGWYYRTMHRPARIWPPASKMIRQAAGQGKLDINHRPSGVYDEIYPAADVCVIGGGPAGMMAALAAAENGVRVILLEARPWLGGHYEYRMGPQDAEMPLYQRARDLSRRVADTPHIRVLRQTALIGAYQGNLITAFQRGGPEDRFAARYVEITAHSVVVATGCIERPLLFANNERPGVMQIGCAHRLARTWGLLPGRKAVFSVGHDLGLEAAVDLHDLGLEVVCVADLREDGHDGRWVAALAERQIPFYRGWAATVAHGAKQVKQVTLAPLSGVRQRRVPCDTLVASAGLTPMTGPLTLAGAKLAYDDRTGYFLPHQQPERMFAAGRLWGLADPAMIEASGRQAGLQAVAACGIDVAQALEQVSASLAQAPQAPRGTKIVTTSAKPAQTFICFDEDATLKNVDQAIAMGFDVPELIKRFTAAGTGPGQGGIPGHNLPLYVSQTGDSPDPTPRPTTVRPPLVPTLVAAYAGSNHAMCKQTPVHAMQVAAGGQMERIGVWQRARRFSSDSTAREEIENVRRNVGMLDASTLGKFRLFGPDALKALQRVYVGDMARVVEGRIKYSAMCNQDGCVIDDGVVTQIGDNDFYLTTSTGRAGATAEWIRYHTRFENWDFHIVNLTDAYGVINLAGPNAREVLAQVTTDDISNDRFGFAACRELQINAELVVRAMRLGFVGELSYELHVPAAYMQAVWHQLEAAGKKFDIRNFGLEAQSTLRLEKGHVILGSESEQRTTLHDIGLGFLWDRDKADTQTVGAIALRQTEHQPGRLKLVGFTMEDPTGAAPRDGSPIVDTRIRGYVCTARYSPVLQQPIGMALVDAALAEPDSRIEIYEDGCQGVLKSARVVRMPFYDPDGARMKM